MASAFPNALALRAIQAGPIGNTTGQPLPWQQVGQDGAFAYNDPMQAQVDYLQQRMNQPMQPTYTPDQIAARKADNSNQYNTGLLGALSGDPSLGEAGGQVLKQALANRQVKYTDHGTYDPVSGEFNYSPDYLQERDAGMLSQAMQRQAQMQQQWQETQSRNLERATSAQQHNEVMAAMRASGGQNQTAFHPAGTAADGTPVVIGAKDGLTYKATFGANNQPTYTPYQGPIIPPGALEKNTETAADNLASAGRIDLLLGQVSDHPRAFGLAGSTLSALPAVMQGMGASVLGLSPEDVEARASLMRQASLELNHLYGAAVSAHEEARANTFLPNQNDTPQQIIAKLTAARDWAKSNAAALGPAALNAAQNRGAGAQTMGGGAALPQPVGFGATAAGVPRAAPQAAAPNDPLGLRTR